MVHPMPLIRILIGMMKLKEDAAIRNYLNIVVLIY